LRYDEMFVILHIAISHKQSLLSRLPFRP